MSTAASSAVWAFRGGPEFASGYRLVLLRLAEVAHDDGTNAFLGVDSMADDCEMARSSVQRALRWLEEHGMIVVQHQATNRRPTVYQLTIPGLRIVTEPVDVGDGLGPQNAAPRRRADAAQGQRRGSVGAAPTRPDPDPDPDPDPVDEEEKRYSIRRVLWKTYEEIALASHVPVHVENRFELWITAGVTVEQIAAARSNIQDWDPKPEHPWSAFAHTLSSIIQGGTGRNERRGRGGARAPQSGAQSGTVRGGRLGAGNARGNGAVARPNRPTGPPRGAIVATTEDVQRAFGKRNGTHP